MDRPTEPSPPASGGWGQEPPGGWGARPPAQVSRPAASHRGGVRDGCSGGRLLARRFPWRTPLWEEQPVHAVTVTSIVTSLVPAPTTRRRADHHVGAGDNGRRGRRRRPGGRGRRTTSRRPRPTTTRPPSNCPSYPDFCVPPPPPDLDCADIGVETSPSKGPTAPIRCRQRRSGLRKLDRPTARMPGAGPVPGWYPRRGVRSGDLVRGRAW